MVQWSSANLLNKGVDQGESLSSNTNKPLTLPKQRRAKTVKNTAAVPFQLNTAARRVDQPRLLLIQPKATPFSVETSASTPQRILFVTFSTKLGRSLRLELLWVKMAVPVVSVTLNSELRLRPRRR